MPDKFQDYGVIAGVVAIIAGLLETLRFLVNKVVRSSERKEREAMAESLVAIARILQVQSDQIDTMYKWHAPDASGQQTWKLSVLKEHLKNEAEASKQLAAAIQSMSAESSETNTLLREMLRRS
jgi:hypothetical protein